MLQIEKVIHAHALKENFIVTRALIEEANDSSQVFVDWGNFEFVKPEHDLEGIYKMTADKDFTGEFKGHVNSLAYEINGVSELVTRANIILGQPDFEHPKFDLDSVTQRKTLNGQKLYKTVRNYLKKVERLSSTLDDLNSVNYSLKIWMRDAERALKRLEALDQKGGHFQKVDVEMYVRLSFRTQDVAGMSSLGRFTSCQDIRLHGWDCNSVGVLGSLLSESIGTLTMFNTLEDALTRDTERLYGQAEHIARLTIARDIDGTVHLGSKVYKDSDNDDAHTLIMMFVEHMEEVGKTVPYQDMKQIEVKRTRMDFDSCVSYRFHGDLDFRVEYTSYDEDEILDLANTFLDENDPDHCEDYEDLGEALEALNDADLIGDFQDELLDLVDVNSYDFTSSYLDIDDTEDRGLTHTISDYDVNDYTDVYTLDDNLRHQFNNMDIHEMVTALNDGSSVVEAYVEIEVLDEDNGQEFEIEPYLEGTVNRLSLKLV